MASFEIVYEQDEDVLEVTFEVFDENFSRAIALNDNIILHTDTDVKTAWGITFYSFARLLEVSETHLDGVKEFVETDIQRLLRVLAKQPVCNFIEILDTSDLRALVKAPPLHELLTV